MNGKLSNTTIKRLEHHTGQPISKGVNKAISQCLDELDELKDVGDGTIQMKVCENTKEIMEEDG